MEKVDLRLALAGYAAFFDGRFPAEPSFSDIASTGETLEVTTSSCHGGYAEHIAPELPFEQNVFMCFEVMQNNSLLIVGVSEGRIHGRMVRQTDGVFAQFGSAPRYFGMQRVGSIPAPAGSVITVAYNHKERALRGFVSECAISWYEAETLGGQGAWDAPAECTKEWDSALPKSFYVALGHGSKLKIIPAPVVEWSRDMFHVLPPNTRAQIYAFILVASCQPGLVLISNELIDLILHYFVAW